MSLLDQHNEMLKTSLESPEYFGVPITFFDDSGSLRYTLNGQVDIHSQHSSTEGDDVAGGLANCTVRFSTLAEVCGYPSDLDWNENLPAQGWTISTFKTSLKIPCAFLLEEGSKFPDYHLPIVTFFLTELEIEEVEE